MCHRCGHSVPSQSIAIHDLRCSTVDDCKLCGKPNLPRHENEHVCDSCGEVDIIGPHTCKVKTPCPLCTLYGCNDKEYCIAYRQAINHLIYNNMSRERSVEIVNKWIDTGVFRERLEATLKTLRSN